MIVIIHGPMASGKTFHKQAFAKHFGCSHIVDCWDPHMHEVPEDGRLVLTYAEPDAIGKAIRKDMPRAEVRLVDIRTARLAIGVAPIAPPLPARRASR